MPLLLFNNRKIDFNWAWEVMNLWEAIDGGIMADLDLAIDVLLQQMMELQVMDVMRSLTTLRTPSLTNSQRFDIAATKSAKCTRRTFEQKQHNMTAFFGCLPIVKAKAWEIDDAPTLDNPTKSKIQTFVVGSWHQSDGLNCEGRWRSKKTRKQHHPQVDLDCHWGSRRTWTRCHSLVKQNGFFWI